jgi:hypothetical protein
MAISWAWQDWRHWSFLLGVFRFGDTLYIELIYLTIAIDLR